MSVIIENRLYQIDSSGSIDLFERVNFRHSLGNIKNKTLAWLCSVFFSYLGHAKQARDNRGDEKSLQTVQVCLQFSLKNEVSLKKTEFIS